MISAAAFLMLSSMLYSLRLSSGSFPQTPVRQRGAGISGKSRSWGPEARNILIERNLRLVAHIMKNTMPRPPTRRI